MTPQLNAAIAKAKLEMPAILANRNVNIPTKSGRNISFTYAELEEILPKITPVLSNNGLSLVHQMGFVGEKYCLISSLRHESGEQIESIYLLPSAVGDAKELGVQISYGRRYSTLCLLDINVIEPDSQEWDEKKRKIAREIRQEINQSPAPKPTSKEPSILHAMSGERTIPASLKTEQPSGLFPAHNGIVKQVRLVTGHQPDWIFKQCKYYGQPNPEHLPPDLLEKLVTDMCVDYAVSTSAIPDRDNAYNSFGGAIAFARASGSPFLDAALLWLQRNQAVSQA